VVNTRKSSSVSQQYIINNRNNNNNNLYSLFNYYCIARRDAHLYPPIRVPAAKSKAPVYYKLL